MELEPYPNETAPRDGVEESTAPTLLAIDVGIAAALKAEDSGDWRPVADWLAHNPGHAIELAEFLAAQRGLRSMVAPTLFAPPSRVSGAVGGLELKGELGRGAMGVVYRAFDSALKRDVAVKMVGTGQELSAVQLARFRYEAEVVASLDHPNIVSVHSYGETGGVPFLVMPLMPGGSLAAWLKDRGPDRRLQPTQAAGIVRDIALGVHHAHQSGLIHRDLKPGNVLLDASGRPHVADFGLAKSQDASVSSAGAGTPSYMAPEQARMDRALTTAVDVYALGVILFELLLGEVPFRGPDVVTVLRRVIEEPAPAVRTHRPDVPRDLELVCATCLSKSPRDRYPSALALAEDLTRFLNGEPLSGERRGGVRDAVARALGWQRETLAMASWRVVFWGAASTALAMTALQAAVLMDAPLWVSQAALAYYLIGWLGVMWWFLVARRDSLNPVERASTAIHFGAKFGCMAILPVELWLHDGNPLYALPPFLVLIGLAVFVHGVTYWGRLYLIGLAFFAAAAAMPLVPVTYWPTLYGLLLTALQIQMGTHLRSVHASAEAGRQLAP